MTEQEIVQNVILVKENNDSAAMARIINQFTPLIRRLSRKINPMNIEDAFQDGTIALWRAARDFDPSKNFRFNTFAYKIMESCMIRNLHNSRDLSHGISYGIANFSKVKDNEKFRTAVNPVDIDALGPKEDENINCDIEDALISKEIRNRLKYLVVKKEEALLLDCIIENPVEKFTSPSIQPSLFEFANFVDLNEMEKCQKLAEARRDVRKSAHMARLYLGLVEPGKMTLQEIADMYGVERTEVRKRVGKFVRFIRKDSKLKGFLYDAA